MRLLRRLLTALLAVVLIALLAGWLVLRASLPKLDGTQALAGLGAEVTVERDANGVPTIRAASKEDLYRALGFLHAQDRFFQMDLLRRQAAGELAELFGPAALPLDREARRHGLRGVTDQVLARLGTEERSRLDDYVAGVNAGLKSLGARPWEYQLLRFTPRPWTREDSILAVYAMFFALQESDGLRERMRVALAETYGNAMLAFLWPNVPERTAALDGYSQPAPPVPDAAQVKPRVAAALVPPPPEMSEAEQTLWAAFHPPTEMLPGSNNFALAGSRVLGGGALVANDMHLNLGVPNIWYRASLALPGRTATGVTLPGVAGIVVGSNGNVAWGFTNSYVDTSDVVIVETDPADAKRYRTPEGSEEFQTRRETIRVAGRTEPEILDVTVTRWGPLLPQRDAAGRPLALHWMAHDPAAVNVNLAGLMDARSLDEAVAIAQSAGMPAQNIVVGDRTGVIAWTIAGRVPKRFGHDGLLPQSWADGARGWNGVLSPAETPIVREPASGQLWSANNRVIGGEAVARLGNGGYDDAPRAAQIRDRLSALTKPATPRDLLAIQLDDESLVLRPWRDTLLATLSDNNVRTSASLAELRRLIKEWHGHAAVAEPGHRLIREFRRTVTETVLNPIYEPVKKREPQFRAGRVRAEQALLTLLRERPAHFLPPSHASWDALLLHCAQFTADLGGRLPSAPPLRDCTWGRANTLAMTHPLARALPAWLGRWLLEMPAQELPGDADQPRVQTPNFGASERMVVSPGREAEGIFHQPGGASGHILSPFYRAGHADWAEGRPSPFLPGPPTHRLTLHR